ncbi:ATP-binding protein [Acutalibacter muris]|uniref:ATP-binding protein n=1 Tax=Acutalibacter muris TaxID=1796620 RepID=A0A1Z2XNX2_9FIRM|nr:ATP-binding protein [Acutalibacter muris]ANU53191.1 hypothetical protein A4V00_03640 [Hungateiclostridiaceae bacterium KB18]ASB40135.1 hypothetical protein ADH66_05355 [Acutalibacter muris]QQR29421.1 ATP-binding protein [Acutalibacter muris]
MSYDKTIAQAARTELERRRSQAEKTARQNLEGFLSNCPRAKEISRELAKNSAGAARAVLSGGNVHEELEQRKKLGLALREEYEELLKAHGLTRHDIEPRYSCSECRDTGFVDGRMCGCHRALRRSIAYRQLSAGLPLEQCTFQSFLLDYYEGDPAAKKRMKEILDTCRKYAENLRPRSSNLLFWGGTGLGKTHLSLAIANAAIEKGFGVVYGSAQKFALAIEKERFSREDSVGTANSLKECDLLILDDLGVEFSSPYSDAAIYDVVNERLMAERPTIISTNLDPSGLEKRYGERFASRIVGGYALMRFKGRDVRVQKLNR